MQTNVIGFIKRGSVYSFANNVHLSVARVCLETAFDQENKCYSTRPDLHVHNTDFIFRLPSLLSIGSKDCVTSQNTLRCVESIRPSWLEL